MQIQIKKIEEDGTWRKYRLLASYMININSICIPLVVVIANAHDYVYFFPSLELFYLLQDLLPPYFFS